MASHTGFFGGGILPLEAHTRDSMGRVLDFDGDGKADLAVAAACSAYEFSDCPQDGYAIVTYQGNGDGSFKPCPQNLQSSCAPPYGIISGGPATPLRSIAVGDFNGDGKMDVVTASDCLNNQDCSSGSMVILFGQWRRDREVDAAFGPRRGERGAMRQV